MATITVMVADAMERVNDQLRAGGHVESCWVGTRGGESWFTTCMYCDAVLVVNRLGQQRRQGYLLACPRSKGGRHGRARK